MKEKILVFGGTYEGRKLCEYLERNGIEATAYVATEYGEELISGLRSVDVISRRLGVEEMTSVMEGGFQTVVIDATHPYAEEVSQNIAKACHATHTRYIRLLREEIEAEGLIHVKNAEEAARYLHTTEGNVLVTTGSKDLSAFCSIEGYEKRLYIRILPDVESLRHCRMLGFSGKNIIAMQGPFSLELNTALIKQYDCKYLVTKSSGSPGGVEEKIRAAEDTGCRVLLIERPTKETGHTLREVIRMLEDQCNVKKEFFPLFVPSNGKKALLVGGGTVALRRVKTLLLFRFDITVIAPEITDELKELCEEGKIKIEHRAFRDGDIEGQYLVIAATNVRAVNEKIGKLADHSGLFVSVCDAQTECNFYFPGVVTDPSVVVGITSEGSSHKTAKETVEKIRASLR